MRYCVSIQGWIAGAILALADGLIWSELGAAMPGAGGTYIYFCEEYLEQPVEAEVSA